MSATRWSARRAVRVCAGLLVASLSAAGCATAPEDPRPSILLVVIDTLRADAVSAYGAVEGTTPNFDALAQEGRLFTHAYAPSPWTLPSHASLFTGLRVDAHGVGTRGRTSLPAGIETVAEQLAAAGYQTAGFSENPLISADFGMARGFAHFSALTVATVMDGSEGDFDIVEEVAAFTEAADAGAPLFLFANLFDAHHPYVDREVNRFVPEGARVGLAWTPGSLRRSPNMLCDRLPPPADVALLRDLYLGDVAVADRKLGRIVELARALAGSRELLVVATSDHGEQFGEHRLLDHLYSVREAVLHVPLVVSGVPGLEPGRIDAPVELADVAASVLAWAGVPPPPTRAGRPLPGSDPDASAPEAARSPGTGSPAGGRPAEAYALYSDTPLETPERLGAGVEVDPGDDAEKRAGCGPADPVFGDMVSVMRWPLKLIWYERYPPELYDLSWDPHERSDLIDGRGEDAAALLEQARRFAEGAGLGEAAAESAPRVSPAEADALRGIGYLE